jgi:uncharacterized protein DUF4760
MDTFFISAYDWLSSQAATSIITAIATVVLAFVGVVEITNGWIARRAAKMVAAQTRTLDLINAMATSQQVTDILDNFRKIREKYAEDITYEKVIEDYQRYRGAIENLDSSSLSKHEYDSILQLLNYYEAWELGIDNDALDENILRGWWRSSLVRDFIKLYSFVCVYRKRTGVMPAFTGVEKLAKRWMTQEERKHLKAIDSSLKQV